MKHRHRTRARMLALLARLRRMGWTVETIPFQHGNVHHG